MSKENPDRLKDLGRVKDTVILDPRVIVIEEGHNPRNFALPENRAHIEELKASILEHGVLLPLLVRWEAATKQPILVDGETRLRSVLELISEGHEIVSVPTLQVSAANDADRLVLALTANTGKPLSQWESGVAYQKLRNFGWEDEQIAKRMGQSVAFVRRAIDLSDATEEMKELLSRKAVTPALAAQLKKQHGSNAARVAKERGASPEAPLKREKADGFAGLKAAVAAVLAEADQQRDAMNVEIHRDNIHALRVAFQG